MSGNRTETDTRTAPTSALTHWTSSASITCPDWTSERALTSIFPCMRRCHDHRCMLQGENPDELQVPPVPAGPRRPWPTGAAQSQELILKLLQPCPGHGPPGRVFPLPRPSYLLCRHLGKSHPVACVGQPVPPVAARLRTASFILNFIAGSWSKPKQKSQGCVRSSPLLSLFPDLHFSMHFLYYRLACLLAV